MFYYAYGIIDTGSSVLEYTWNGGDGEEGTVYSVYAKRSLKDDGHPIDCPNLNVVRWNVFSKTFSGLD